MKLMSARASRAPAPHQHGEARARHLRARARSRGCRAAAPRSQCAFGSKSNAARLAPRAHLDVVGRRSARPARSRAAGWAASAAASSRCCSTPSSSASSCLICCAARLVGREMRDGVLALPLGARHLLAGRVLLALERLRPAGISRRRSASSVGQLLAARPSASRPRVAQAVLHRLDVVADECGVEHALDRSPYARACGYDARPGGHAA